MWTVRPSRRKARQVGVGAAAVAAQAASRAADAKSADAQAAADEATAAAAAARSETVAARTHAHEAEDEAAGASFLAFGSSAPEIVIATIATLSGGGEGGEGGGEGGESVGLSTVLGSAVLAFGLIPAVSAILAPPADSWDVATVPPELYKGGLLLEIRPLIRDVGFCVIGFAMICE